VANKGAAHYKQRRPGKVRVRCLGPGKEHTFLSADPRTNRVCVPCQAVIAARYASPLYDEPLRAPE
jgi:hypothetical protein